MPRTRSIPLVAAAFVLVTVAPAAAEYEFSDEMPTVVVRVPVPCPPASDPRRAYAVLVGKDGFVRQTLRYGHGPGRPDANPPEVDAALRRWIFKPGRSSEGEAIDLWVVVPVDKIVATRPELPARWSPFRMRGSWPASWRLIR